MSEKSLEVAGQLVAAWINTRAQSSPEPREIADAFDTVHKAVRAAGSAGS